MSVGFGKQSAASVPTPPAGEMNTFIDAADDHLKRKDDTGAVVDIESAASGVTSFNGRTGAVLPAASDYDAGEIDFTPGGSITDTNVQDAVAFLDSTKAPLTHVGAGGVSQHPLATGADAGFMSPSDFTKLGTVATGATANQTDAFLLARANHTGTQLAATISDFSTAADARITLQKAAANGLATLDGSSKIPIAQIPASLFGSVKYKGTWDANTNSPALASSVGTQGDYYVVNAAGSTNLDGVTDWKLGDWAIFNGSVWEKVDNTDAVTSVNGLTGVVVISTTSLGAVPTSRNLTAGTGLTGGGDLSADRTINLANTAVTAASYGGAISIPTFTVDAQGRLTTAATGSALTPSAIGAQPVDATLTALAAFNTNGFMVQTAADTFAGRTLVQGTGITISNADGVSGNPTIATTITQYTDELAQDAVGGGLVDTASIQAVYNDGANSFTFNVIPGGVNHNALLNYVANQHIDHTAVSINPGTLGGLSGGGTIAATRTLSLDLSALTAMVPTTFADRLDPADQLGIYDSSTTTTKKISLSDFLAQRASLIDRAWTEADDFIKDTLGGLAAVGAGTGNSTQAGTFGQDTTENAIGISQTDTGTTTTGRRTLSSGLGALMSTLARYRIAWRIALEALSNGTDTYTAYIGFMDTTASGNPGNGAFFRYTNGVNGGRWEACTNKAAGAVDATDTTVAANVLYNIFEVEISADGANAYFYINGTLVATKTTNIPTATSAQTFGYGFKIEKSAGTTQSNLSADWYCFELERASAR